MSFGLYLDSPPILQSAVAVQHILHGTYVHRCPPAPEAGILQTSMTCINHLHPYLSAARSPIPLVKGQLHLQSSFADEADNSRPHKVAPNLPLCELPSETISVILSSSTTDDDEVIVVVRIGFADVNLCGCASRRKKPLV